MKRRFGRVGAELTSPAKHSHIFCDGSAGVALTRGYSKWKIWGQRRILEVTEN